MTNPNRIPNRVNSLWRNKPKNMAAAGIRTRGTSLDNRHATRYATAPTLQSSFAKFIFREYSRTPEA